MQQQTLRTVVRENSNNANSLSVQMIDLRVVQQAIANLMNRFDEITDRGWHEDRGMACLSILQIQDSLRLIDMAFHPLFKNITEEVNTLNIHAEELYQTVVKSESEQSTVAATKLDINSKVGWNAFAMEGNIKTFTKEFGREPDSFEEVLTYITKTVAKVVGKGEENKKATAGTVTSENITN
ncbi:hypothetical protein [Lysinibacillus sp. NPDC047702]|uniref:hypothetical protein n=1 Tax=unclassified Lysinibacillus TaxID=2636778 RepID=UPI003D061F92